MKIISKQNFFLSNKLKNQDSNNESKVSEKQYLKQNNSDKFEHSTPATKPISFRGVNANPKQVAEMLKSNSYFKILASLIVATGTTLWNQLKDLGLENEENVSKDDIIKILTESVSETLNSDKNANTAVNLSGTMGEEIIEIETNQVKSSEAESIDASTTDGKETVNVDDNKPKNTRHNTRRDTDENVRIITELVQTGQYTQVEIARKTGIPELAVSRIVRKHNLQTPKRLRKEIAQSLTNEQILQAYEDNKYSTKIEVAKSLGITLNDLEKICKERNLPEFVKLKKIEQLNKELLLEEFSKGLTTQEIAQKYDVKIYVVRKAYNEFGIENPNRKQRVQIDENLIEEIKRRKENQESNETIATELGVAPITVDRIVQGKNTTLSLDLKKLAEQGCTIEQAAEKTGKPIKIIKIVASRYNITFAESTKKNITNTKIDLKKLNPPLDFKKTPLSITEDDVFFMFPQQEVILNDEAKQVIESLKDDLAKDISVIKALETARLNSNLKTYKIARSLQTSKENVVRYSNEDLMDRYLAKSYLLFKSQFSENEIKNFINKTKLPRVILNKEDSEFIKDVWRFKDAEVPTNDPLFEEYKKCFDKKAILLQIEILKSNYKKSIIEKLSDPDVIKVVQDSNPSYVEITPQTIFNLVFQTKYKSNYAKINIPGFNTTYDNADTLQKELIDTINKFKQKALVNEYIDLVKIYNNFCVENYDKEFAETLLTKLKHISDEKDFTRTTLKELITASQTGTIITSDINKQTELEVVDYTAFSLNELKAELEEIYNKLPADFNEELRTRIVDFTICAEEEDFDKLCEFMYIVNDVLSGKLPVENALSEIALNKTMPSGSSMSEWILQETAKQIRNNIVKLYDELPATVKNNSKFISTIYNDINYIELMSFEKLEKLQKLLERLKEASNNTERVEKILDVIVNQKVLLKEIRTSDKIKEFVLENITIKDQKDFDEAMNCLNKIDKYNSIPKEERVLIRSVLDLFNEEASNIEKQLISFIIHNECLNKDSVIYNKAYGEYATITKELKQEFLNTYIDQFIVLKWFEDAAALKADSRGSAGIKDLSKNNSNPTHSMEIKILNKNYGQIRFFSEFSRDKNGNIIKKDKNGNIIKNFVFTKLNKDH